jgi:hypothetical protein
MRRRSEFLVQLEGNSTDKAEIVKLSRKFVEKLTKFHGCVGVKAPHFNVNHQSGIPTRQTEGGMCELSDFVSPLRQSHKGFHPNRS